MGDSIDSIPGVKGIGPKGALELIQKFGNVENLLENVETIEKKSHRQNIEESRKDLSPFKRACTTEVRCANRCKDSISKGREARCRCRTESISRSGVLFDSE